MTYTMPTTKEMRERAQFESTKERFFGLLQRKGNGVPEIIGRVSVYLEYCRTGIATSPFAGTRRMFVDETVRMMREREIILLLPLEVFLSTIDAYERMLEDPSEDVRYAAINGLKEPALFTHTAEALLKRIENSGITDVDINHLLGVLEFFGKEFQKTPEATRKGEQVSNFEGVVDAVAYYLYKELDEAKDALLNRVVDVLSMLRSAIVNEKLVKAFWDFTEELRVNEMQDEIVFVQPGRYMADILELMRRRRLVLAVEPLSEILRIAGNPENRITIAGDVILDVGRTLTTLGVPTHAYTRTDVFGDAEWTGLRPVEELH